MNIQCKNCNNGFEYEKEPGRRGRNPVYCPTCKEQGQYKLSKAKIARDAAV